MQRRYVANKMSKLEDKIKNEIINSGFPLEIYCKKLIFSKGFGLKSNKYYLNDKNEFRELDGLGVIPDTVKINSKDHSLSSYLYIECKRNQSYPWIFLEGNYWSSYNIYHQIKSRKNFNEHDFYNNIKLSKDNLNEYSETYFVGFVNQDNNKISRQIYDSIIKLIEYSELSKKRILKNKFLGKHIIDIIHLCVVFEGQLFFASFKGKNIKVSRKNHIVVNVTNESSKKVKNYAVDVVTKEYFNQYLSLIKKDHSTIKRYMKNL